MLPAQKGMQAMKETSTFSSSRLRQLRRRHILLWLLFFLVIGIVFALTLLSWQHSLRPAQVALVFRSPPSDQLPGYNHSVLSIGL